ncbi:hypothetical protein [Thermofilum pendens]|uniref:hypothetical protein n=1 Tax=Thermofilum pendens TaxID=2269 RepID=UPI00069C4178|nr:hypothetical protein [Thermofilum pendens]
MSKRYPHFELKKPMLGGCRVERYGEGFLLKCPRGEAYVEPEHVSVTVRRDNTVTEQAFFRSEDGWLLKVAGDRLFNADTSLSDVLSSIGLYDEPREALESMGFDVDEVEPVVTRVESVESPEELYGMARRAYNKWRSSKAYVESGELAFTLPRGEV